MQYLRLIILLFTGEFPTWSILRTDKYKKSMQKRTGDRAVKIGSWVPAVACYPCAIANISANG